MTASSDACAKCGKPLPTVERGPPRRLCTSCRTATLVGVAAVEEAKVTSAGVPPPPAAELEPAAAEPQEPAVEAGAQASGAKDDEPPERSSVLADLRAMSAAVPAPEQRRVDDDLLRMPGGDHPDAGTPAAEGVMPAGVGIDDAKTEERSPFIELDLGAAPPPVALAPAVVDRCAHCGSIIADVPAKPDASLVERVQALLRRRAVRTYAPWAVAGASMLVAIVALIRGGAAPSSKLAAATASAAAEQAEAPAGEGATDAGTARPVTQKVASPAVRPKPAATTPMKPGATKPVATPTSGARKPATTK